MGSLLTVVDGSAVFGELSCQIAFLGIGAGNPETIGKKNACKTAHGDASDAYKINMHIRI